MGRKDINYRGCVEGYNREGRVLAMAATIRERVKKWQEKGENKDNDELVEYSGIKVNYTR